MSRHLHGVHDWNPDWGGIIRDANSTGWAVISEEIGDDPTSHSGGNYVSLASFGVTPIVRLNYSHHGNGTIPPPDRFNAFAERCANFVTASSGCTHWVIGNEVNIVAERYGGVPITPHSYAECFAKCRNMIKQRGLQHIVCPAAVAPYNNDTGWCMDYWRDMLAAIARSEGDGGADALNLHTYSRGGDPSSITSEHKMDAPYQNCYSGFRAYRDFLALVPAIMRALPVYITETDQLSPWEDRNSGWVQGAYAEIDEWNSGAGHQGIHCLALYRFENFDQWGFSRKNGVIDDFRAAVSLGYQSPLTPHPPTPTPTPPDPPRPPTPTPAPEPTPTPIDWDPRLTVRGCKRLYSDWPMGSLTYVTQIGRWFDPDEAQGRVSVYVRLLDEAGQLAIGEPVTWFWSSGSETKLTERKSDPWLESMGLGREYSCDFAMYNVAPSYGIRIDGDYAGDIINGCGLGSIEQPDWKIHTAYFFQWQLSSTGITEPVPPILPPPVVPVAGHLIWPVTGPVSQRWGENPDFYQEALGIPYHNGTDVGIPVGTEVIAAADGIVKWVDDDKAGYGVYCRLYFPAFRLHILTAHLDRCIVQVGDQVQQGQVIAYSGNSGLSSGPHTHVETRLGTEHSYAQGTFGNSNGRVDPQAVYWAYGGTQEPIAGPGR